MAASDNWRALMVSIHFSASFGRDFVLTIFRISFTPFITCFSIRQLYILLMTNIWSQIVQATYEKGYGEKDTVAFYEVLRGMAGLSERPGIDDVSLVKPE